MLWSNSLFDSFEYERKILVYQLHHVKRQAYGNGKSGSLEKKCYV
jgi:hypothetical protein